MAILSFLLASCTSTGFPPDPSTPDEGKTEQTVVAGKAFFTGLENLGYSQPTRFTINADSLSKGEVLSLTVQNEDYVYKYYYLSINGQWEKRTFPGTAVGTSNWLASSATTSLSTEQLPEGDNYVVVYSCSKIQSGWDCHNNKWQIHQFKIFPGPKLPPLEPQCGSDQECPLHYQCDSGKCVPLPAEPAAPSSFASYCGDDFSGLMKPKFLWSLDFENVDEDGWILGWNKPRLQVPGNLVGFELDSTVKHSGQYSLKISAADATYSGVINPFVHSSLIGVIPGEQYTLSFWAKGENVISYSGYLAIYHKTGKIVPAGISQANSAYWFAPFPSQSPTYDWQYVVSTFTVPANQDAAWVNILFQNGAGTVWLDDIVVMPSSWYNALPETTVKVETTTNALGEPAHHYFLRNKLIHANAIVQNQKGASGTYEVKAALSYCGTVLQQVQQKVQIPSYERAVVPLLTIDPASLEVGDYLLNVSIEQNGQIMDSVLHPLGLRLDPKPEFLFSVGTGWDYNTSSALARMDRLKAHSIDPLIYGGNPAPYVADAVLSRNMPFIIRQMPNVVYPKKKGVHGEEIQGVYALGLSDENAWAEAAVEISNAVRWASHFPAFFPRIFTSDDGSTLSGWDWADENKERFTQLTGMPAPVPPEIFNAPPTPIHSALYSSVGQISYPKGSVPVNEPWLAWNRFLTKDVLGAYNKEVTNAVINTNPEAKIGPIPGGAQWPLFQTLVAMYPPSNFGEHGFNMISYYMYLNFWRPELAYMYWTDIARMGNRNLPVYVMPDNGFTESSYHWNNFYLLLAAGVDGISYFIDQEGWASQEFWDLAANKLGPLVEKYGALFVKLQPQERKVGLLSSHTTSSYYLGQPLDDLCAYINLILAHVDVETVSEEELLAGRLEQYDVVVLNNVDWLRQDIFQVLSNSPSTKIILDKDSEVPLSSANVVKLQDLDLMRDTCVAVSWGNDYANATRLSSIHAIMETFSPAEVHVDKDTVIYRRYVAGTSQYLWLVDVHTFDEYKANFEMMTYKGGYDNQTARAETIAYLRSKDVYGGTTTAMVQVQTPPGVVAVDVLTGTPLLSSYANGWLTFEVEIERLAGKLIALYPAVPTAVGLAVPPTVTAGTETLLAVSVFAGNNAVSASFPLYLELRDPSGKIHSYSHFAATNEQGSYSLPLLLGTNAPKGSWTVEVQELSTGISSSAHFILS